MLGPIQLLRARMASYKTEVIEYLFNERWSSDTGEPTDTVVTLAEVQAGIQAYNARHGTSWSDRNPANFFKDFIRRRESANRNWPRSVLDRGYTARQLTGSGQAFAFVLLEPGQTEAFPVERIPPPTAATPRHVIQSVSLPLASRKLGRAEETWLTQVLVRLHVVETHLAVYSPRTFTQIDHLQMSMKLRRAEIDSVYLGLEETVLGDSRHTLIACEAKGRSDDILADQIMAQAKSMARLSVDFDYILPMAAKILGSKGIHLVEFEAVKRVDVPELERLSIASEALYQLSPPVPGIG